MPDWLIAKSFQTIDPPIGIVDPEAQVMHALATDIDEIAMQHVARYPLDQLDLNISDLAEGELQVVAAARASPILRLLDAEVGLVKRTEHRIVERDASSRSRTTNPIWSGCGRSKCFKSPLSFGLKSFMGGSLSINCLSKDGVAAIGGQCLPVMWPAAALVKNRTAPAISSGLPMRPSSRERE